MSSPQLRASALYKKQDGTISLSRDPQTVLWTPVSPPGAPPSLKITVTDITSTFTSMYMLEPSNDTQTTDLQQSPATSTKVSIRVVVQPSGAAAPENHDFRFTSPTAAKAEQEAIVGALKDIISNLRAGSGPPAAMTANSPLDSIGQSAAMTFALAVSGARAVEDDQFSDVRLLADSNLQKSLLESSPELLQRFHESFNLKPATISLSQFSAEFWSSRLHILRAHAIEKSQRQGVYNVLSEIKPKDGKLQLTKEQIHLVFNQHPLVRSVYDALTPKPFSESEFWSNFFSSKLFKKLKGEKITELDADVPEMDRYLTADEDAGRTRQFVVSRIPRFIDLEGNEQNHSQRKGNLPDFTMRPNSYDKVPILRVLNNMSEQMMGNVEPADEEMFAPVGQLEEEEIRQLQDKFLQPGADDTRITLHIQDQQKFFSRERERERRPSKAVKPDIVLREIAENLYTTPTLFTEFDEEEEGQAENAAKNIMKSVKRRAEHLTKGSEGKVNLSPSVKASAVMTHNTTIEFLHYFWTVFLSGDESRAGELQNLVETLEKSLKRVDAVAAEAAKEREEILQKRHHHAEEMAQRTGKRRKIDMMGVTGGKPAVNDLLRATVRAVKYADAEYRGVFQEQMKEQMAQQNLAVG